MTLALDPGTIVTHAAESDAVAAVGGYGAPQLALA